jgi:hypothetical protein
VNNAALRGPTPEEIAESKKVLEDLDKREPKNGVLGTVTVE